jgi:PleD family two-component response regulator/EAL domain-containing protein (putative c-di-GMP-specific phosphodiesterase class I)
MPKRTDSGRPEYSDGLSELVKKIETDWLFQPVGNWNGDFIESLVRRLRELSKSREPSDQKALQALVNLIEKKIRSIIAADSGATDNDRIVTLKGILDRLKQAVGVRAPLSPRRGDSRGMDLLLLHRGQSAWDQIEQAVAMREWRYKTVSNLLGLGDALEGGEKVILIDTSFLPELNQKNPGIIPRRDTLPYLFFVSDRCDIEIRMQAIRAGAIKIFSEPINLDALLKALEEHIQPNSGPRHRILVVADYEAQAKYPVDILREAEFDTQILSDPSEVIDVIWGFRPDLILMMDLNNPYADSIVLTRLIRDREESTAIPIVFLSEEEDEENLLQALQAGADDYLTMPMQLNQLATTVRSRINRVAAISAAGVKKSEEPQVELADREGLVFRIEKRMCEQGGEEWLYGVIVIDIDALSINPGRCIGLDSDRLLAAIGSGLKPLLQGSDFLARIGSCSLASLIRRSSKGEMQRVADLVYEIVNYQLSSMAVKKSQVGIGLTMIDKDVPSANHLLMQGELAASAAGQNGQKGFYLYEKGREIAGVAVKGGATWRKEQFLTVLEAGSATLEERRFICRRESARATEIIELIPHCKLPEITGDLFQKAALCGAAGEFDRFICDLGIQRLCEYGLQGKAVTLILHQSAAVIEESDYLDFIKSELRRLHIVGTGLMIEFSLPSLASRLQQAQALFDELSALGIAISLSHFPCNKSGYKVLSHLRADAIRPRSSVLRDESEEIGQISEMIRSLQTRIILPGVDYLAQISYQWWENADCIQADFPREDLVAESFAKKEPFFAYQGKRGGGMRLAGEEAHKTPVNKVSATSGISTT